jgi:hypothetical protein
MSVLATAAFAALATIGATGSPSQTAAVSRDATLNFVSSNSVLAGISFGMNAVDGRSLLLDQRTSTRLAAGRRTIWYSCPGAQGGAISFDFAPETRYELSCGSLGAQIRVAEGC